MAGGGMLDFGEGDVRSAPRGRVAHKCAFQVGRQQFVEIADDDQGHVVRRVPFVAQLL